MKHIKNTPILKRMNLQFFAGDEDGIMPDGMDDFLQELEKDGMFDDADGQKENPKDEQEPEVKPEVEAEPEENIENIPEENNLDDNDSKEADPSGEFDFKPFIEQLNKGMLKHNHENFTYEKIEDLIADAQMGKDRARQVEKVETLTKEIEDTKPKLEMLGNFERLAKMHGYETDAFFEGILNQYFKNAANRNGSTPEFERKQYELTLREEGINKKDQQSQREAEKQKAQDKMYSEFTKEYPDVDVAKLPKAVTDAAKEGKDITKAYSKYLLEESIKREKQLEQQLKNFKTKPSLNGVNMGKDSSIADDDPFMKGFDSVDY